MIDLETGAVVGVTVQDASVGDTTTMVETLVTAAEQVTTGDRSGIMTATALRAAPSRLGIPPG